MSCNEHDKQIEPSQSTKQEDTNCSRRGFLVGSAAVGATILLGNVHCGTEQSQSELTGKDGGEGGILADSQWDSGKELFPDTSKQNDIVPEKGQVFDSASTDTEMEPLSEVQPEHQMTPEEVASEQSVPEPPDTSLPEPVAEAIPERALGFDPASVPVDKTIFSLNVQSGAMRENSAVLWSFASDRKSKNLKVWQEVGNKRMLVIDTSVQPNAGGYLKKKITGLKGGLWYHYAFFNGKQGRSVVGRFRTAFAAGSLVPLMLGASCCTKLRYAPYKSLQLTAKEPIDMFVHLGDFSYNDGAKTLADYRAFWKKAIVASGYPELLPKVGMYVCWDDHEVFNNFDPEKMNKTQFAVAKEAFTESMPVEYGAKDRFWNSYVWGDTAEFFVLDCRGERHPSTRKGKNAIYISQAQLKWLQAGLKKSKAHFKVILNSVPITNMPINWISTGDRWEGYKAQRTQLLSFITNEKISNVWFLTGDFHTSFVGRLEKSGPWSKLYEIACGPGGAFPNPWGVGGLRKVGFPKNQFLFGQSVQSMMTTIKFDPKNNNVHVRLVDGSNGKTLFDKKLTQA